MTSALAASCNVVFGKLAVKVGAEDLEEQAQRFGFGDDNFLDGLTVVPSRFTGGDPADLNGPETAQSGIGQFDVATTPLQMAMVVAGIGNDGTVMKPYVVSQTRSPEARRLDTIEPEVLTEDAVSPEVAEELTEMMVGVVEAPEGTAGSLAIPGSGSAARPAPPSAARTTSRTRGWSGSHPRTTRRWRSRSSCRTPARMPGRSPAAAWPARSPSRSSRR
jgi:peptidoglycan glycosyltransferase